MYIYIFISIHVHIHTFIHTYIYIHIYLYIYSYVTTIAPFVPNGGTECFVSLQTHVCPSVFKLCLCVLIFSLFYVCCHVPFVWHMVSCGASRILLCVQKPGSIALSPNAHAWYIYICMYVHIYTYIYACLLNKCLLNPYIYIYMVNTHIYICAYL